MSEKYYLPVLYTEEERKKYAEWGIKKERLMTLHINEHYGKNTHHIIEAIFKSMARAIKEAVTIDEAHIGQVVSSKGVL